MKENFEETFKHIPEKIKTSVLMTEANQTILIYDGPFVLKSKVDELNLTGKIEFSWLPDIGVRFKGYTIDKSVQTLQRIDQSSFEGLYIDNLFFGRPTVLESTFHFNSYDSLIKGVMMKDAILGDRTICVNKVIFSIPNLREFFGEVVKEHEGETGYLNNSRMVFENDEYSIIVDKIREYSQLKESLKSNGGFIVLYSGEIIKKSGSISIKETNDILHCFSKFLSFLNGKRCAPLFRQGFCESQLIWTDYSAHIVDSYRYVITWPQKHSIEGLNEIWLEFERLWKTDRHFLTTVIHWYVEANSHSGFTEGSIIIAQTALELLYNWLLIENKKLLLGKDAENLSASNKIRLLLAQLNLPNEVPSALSHLTALVNTNRDIIDAPDAFVQIRNAIIHSQEEKRNKLSKIPAMAKYEALQLGIWYTELVLLYILKFKGKYFNRSAKALYAGEGEEFVPWK
jgi:hypothetical protein